MALVSCNKEASIVDPTGIGLDKTSISIFAGETYDLAATIEPSNASASQVIWTSSNTKVAAVTGHGQVIGVAPDMVKAGPASAVITAKTADGKFSAKCNVTVKPIVATAINISAEKDAKAAFIGEELKLTATITPDNASYKTLTWSSSDEKLATVNDGKVLGIATGKVTITATNLEGVKGTIELAVEEANPTEPTTVDIWVDDAAGTKKLFGAAADNGKSADFLSFNNGVVSWSENTTGAPRTATLELSTGSKITVMQVSPVDFKGNWKMTAKSFSNNTSVVNASNNKVVNVVIGDPVGGVQTLEDHEGATHTNALGVKGLYGEAVMNACVEIDYVAKTAKFGAFLDARKAQPVSVSNISGYPYVCFLPEMGTDPGVGKNWAAPWNFIQPDLDSEKDYCWIWFNANDKLSGFEWYSFSDKQYMNGNLKTPANCIIGITCAVCKGELVNADNVYGTYNVIYQANTNSDTVVPMSFSK